MGRIARLKGYIGRKAVEWSPVGEALRAYDAGYLTLKFDWTPTFADTWIDVITSHGQWKVDSIKHPFVWDDEKDEAKAVVRVTFVRVDPEDHNE